MEKVKIRFINNRIEIYDMLRGRTANFIEGEILDDPRGPDLRELQPHHLNGFCIDYVTIQQPGELVMELVPIDDKLGELILGK